MLIQALTIFVVALPSGMTVHAQSPAQAEQEQEDPALDRLRASLKLVSEALAETGEGVEGAREELRRAVEELPPAATELDGEQWLPALSELDRLGGLVSLIEVQLAARKRWVFILETQQPPEHTDLLRAKSNLAVTLKELGDLEGASEHLEQVHAAWEKLLPPEHPDLLATKFNLAATRYTLLDLQGALELYEHVHAAWEQLLPSEHPHLLYAKQGLALARKRLGDLEGDPPPFGGQGT